MAGNWIIGKRNPNKSKDPSTISTKEWLFCDDSPHGKKQRDGPHLSQWRDKYDTSIGTYRDIHKPKAYIPSKSTSTKSGRFQPVKNSTVYSRYTKSQLRRKEMAKTILDKIALSTTKKRDSLPKIEELESRYTLRRSTHKTEMNVFQKGSEHTSSSRSTLVTEGDDLLFLGKSRTSAQLYRSNRDKTAGGILLEPKPTVSWDTIIRDYSIPRKNPYICLYNKAEDDIEDEPEPELNDDCEEAVGLRKAYTNYYKYLLGIGGTSPIGKRKMVSMDDVDIDCGYDTRAIDHGDHPIVPSSDLPRAIGGDGYVPIFWDIPENKNTKSLSPRRPTRSETDKTQYRYGAWYLKPKTWQYMRKDEPLVDPDYEEPPEDVTQDAITKKWETTIDQLSSMYVTKAVTNYVKVKGCRPPKFLAETMERQPSKTENLN